MNRCVACLAGLLVACHAERLDEPDVQPQTDYQEVLVALEGAARGELERARQGPIEVRGYDFHWQFEAEDGSRVVIVSRNLGGSLLAFSADGTLLAQRDCDEILSVQWMDLDLDGRSEWISEEIDGRGTGLLVQAYRIYRQRDTAIDLIWEGLSYDRRMAAEPFQRGEMEIEIRRGFIKLEPHNSEQPARLLHWVTGPEEEDEERRAYVWLNGRLEEAEELRSDRTPRN